MKRKWTAALLALMLVLALPFSAAAETFSNDDFSLTYPDGMYLFTLSTSVDDPSWALAGIADPQSELQTMQDMSGIAQLVSEDGSTTILVQQQESSQTGRSLTWVPSPKRTSKAFWTALCRPKQRTSPLRKAIWT